MRRRAKLCGRGNFWFDFCIMGVQAVVPFAAWIVLILYCAVFRQDGVWVLAGQLPVLEMILPTFSAWWSICLFQDVLEEEGSETLFSYPFSRWKLGTVRVMFFWAVYAVGMTGVLAFLQTWTSQPFWLPLVVQFTAQSFFFSALGFFSVAATAQVGWAVAVVAGYAVVEQLIGPILPAFLNVYWFNTSPFPQEQWLWIAAKPLIYGLGLMLAAQWLLHHFHRFH